METAINIMSISLIVIGVLSCIGTVILFNTKSLKEAYRRGLEIEAAEKKTRERESCE